MSVVRRQTWLIVIAAVVALVGGYLGVFLIGFSLLYQDIDGPTSAWGRAVGCLIGVSFLVPSVVAAVWAVHAWRRRPKSAPDASEYTLRH